MMRPPPTSDFRDLRATELYCPRCRGPRPVRESLLLVLPEGDLHEYTCAACGESLGKRTAPSEAPVRLVRS